MTLQLIELALVMYVTAVVVLWVATRILAPKGFEFSFSRGLGAAFLMTVFGNASRIFLSPSIGDWYLLVLLLTYVLVVKAVFRLALWRSIVVALSYIGAVAAVYYFLLTRQHSEVLAS